jgi:hypothetical protein
MKGNKNSNEWFMKSKAFQKNILVYNIIFICFTMNYRSCSLLLIYSNVIIQKKQEKIIECWQKCQISNPTFETFKCLINAL